MARSNDIRFTVSFSPELHADATAGAKRCGLSLSGYLEACVEQAAQPGLGLHTLLPREEHAVERSIRGPRGIYSVRSLVTYRRPPERLVLIEHSGGRPLNMPGSTAWMVWARVGDVMVWETSGPFRIGVLEYREIRIVGWRETIGEALGLVRRTIAELGG